MRFHWPILVLCLSLPLCPAALADSSGMSLQNYRAKATYSVPAACIQAGGTVDYSTPTPGCKLPTLSTRVPSSTTTPSRALPLTTKH